MDRQSVEVWADWEQLAGERRLGQLHATTVRGKQVFSFEYDETWLDDGPAHALDPNLSLHHGPQYSPDGRDNFGIFLDSSPDRWGRVLLQRREAQLAREQGRKPRRLQELDYLLGVYDGHRMGGLRFRRDPDGPFLDDNSELTSPPWTSLRELEHASHQLESEDAEDDPAYGKWLRMLIAPGRSLGGARPKASVLDEHGALWIAKFPSTADVDDVGAWEHVIHSLARHAELHTADARCQRFASRHHTFVSKRFDRSSRGGRIHFCSAMTLLERRDGDEGASYLELAEVIMQQGAHPNRDLEQLWRRIVFFVCVSNVDDHLRNHGFLLEPSGWSLAPAYDMNPVATAGGLSLNISENDNAQDLDLVREVSPHFRVNATRRETIIDDVRTAVRSWRDEAKRTGIPRSEQDRMANAFALAETS